MRTATSKCVMYLVFMHIMTLRPVCLGYLYSCFCNFIITMVTCICSLYHLTISISMWSLTLWRIYGMWNKLKWIRQSEKSDTPTVYRTAAFRFVAYHSIDLTRLFCQDFDNFSLYVGSVNEANKSPQYLKKSKLWSTWTSAAAWIWPGWKTGWGIIRRLTNHDVAVSVYLAFINTRNTKAT
jgi:hypothetical protein